MTNALQWLVLRDIYLKLAGNSIGLGYAPCNDLIDELNLKAALKNHAPIDVPDGKGGDLGYVVFADGSEIVYNWDDGLFEYEGSSFEYPWCIDDPLFWSKDED